MVEKIDYGNLFSMKLSKREFLSGGLNQSASQLQLLSRHVDHSSDRIFLARQFYICIVAKNTDFFLHLISIGCGPDVWPAAYAQRTIDWTVLFEHACIAQMR